VTTAPPVEDRRYSIEGRDLGYPTEFRDGQSMMGAFLVSAKALDRLLADSPFTPAVVVPRRGLVSLSCVHYTDTDCGEYDEIALATFVELPDQQSRLPYLPVWRRIAGGEIASHSWRLAVTTELSCQAGLRMWGFPKTVEDLSYGIDDGTACMTWRADGTDVLRFSVPARGERTSGPVSPPVYSVFEGAPHVGHLTQNYRGVGYHRRGVRLELGDHPVADELRGLGVGPRPVMGVWNGHLQFEMGAPRRVGD
jgi:hypothetical protein